MLLEDNNFPYCSYEVRKILCPIGLDYTKTHVCYNDCIVYMQKYEKLNQCPEYGESHYKVKGNSGDDDDDASKKRPPSKVL